MHRRWSDMHDILHRWYEKKNHRQFAFASIVVRAPRQDTKKHNFNEIIKANSDVKLDIGRLHRVFVPTKKAMNTQAAVPEILAKWCNNGGDGKPAELSDCLISDFT